MNHTQSINTLNFLGTLAQKTAELANPHLTVEAIIRETVYFMDASSGSIMVHDEENNFLKLYISAEHPSLKKDKKKNGPVANVPIGESIASQVFLSKEAMLVSSEREGVNEKLIREEDKGSFLSMPLMLNQRIIGVMNLNREIHKSSFVKEDLVTLKSVVPLISSLIEKENLLNKIEENRQEICGLYELSCILTSGKDFIGQTLKFLNKLSELLALDQSAIIEIKASDNKENTETGFEIIAANNLCQKEIEEIFKAIGEAFKKQLLTGSNETNADVEAPLSIKYKKDGSVQEMYCLPLFVDSQLSHMLLVNRKFIQDYENDAKKHYRFLYLISHNLASAISKEKMMARIKQDQDALLETSSRNKVFLEISKDLASSLDPYCILQKAFEQFRKVISFTTIAILLYDDLDKKYRFMLHECKPISLNYYEKLSKEIFELFVEYPTDPPLTLDNFKEFSTFKAPDATIKTIDAFKHRLHLPIIFSDKIKGIIHLARREGENPFNEEDLDVTSQFTGIFLTSIKNAMIHKKTEKLAFTDPLTELFNHRYFQETLNTEFVRAKRYNKPLSLMIIDIDFFKKFNDTYGHLVGDKVLRHVAKIFNSSMREQIDTVARYGGEEFAVILPETDIEGARHFAERIRSSVEKTRIIHEEQSLSVTLSVGVASTKITDCEKTTTLIEAADMALYKAKENGRNRVVSYDEKKV